MPISTFKTIFDSLKGATDITKALVELKKGADISATVMDLNNLIIQAQSNTFTAQTEHRAAKDLIAELENKIMCIEAWSTERVRYSLANVGLSGLAYAVKEVMSNGEPAHYICTNCYEDGRKSILNPKLNDRGFANLHCSKCQNSIPTGDRITPMAKYAKV